MSKFVWIQISFVVVCMVACLTETTTGLTSLRTTEAQPSKPTAAIASDNGPSLQTTEAAPSKPTAAIAGDNGHSLQTTEATPSKPTAAIAGDNGPSLQTTEATLSKPTAAIASDNGPSLQTTEAAPSKPTVAIAGDNEPSLQRAEDAISKPTTAIAGDNGTIHITSETTTHETTATQGVSTETTEYLYNRTTLHTNDTDLNATAGPPEKTYRDYLEYDVILFLQKYYNYFTNVPGLIGNFLTMIVAAKMTPYTTTTICILDLATTDFCMCLMRFIFIFFSYRDIVYCRTNTFFLAFFSCYSNYILVVWTIERLIAVAFPMKIKIWCTVKNTVVALAVALLASFLLSVVYIIEVGSETIVINDETSITDCTYSEFIVNVYGYIDLTWYVLIPMSVILVSNALIIFIMTKRTKARANLTNNTDVQDKREAEQRRMTNVLMAVSFIFLLLHIPYLVKTVFDIHYRLNPVVIGQHFYAKYLLLGVIAAFVLQFQNVVNFLIYCLSGPTFRKEFVKVICFCKSKPA